MFASLTFRLIRQQQRSEILICFLRRRQVFSKISFYILSNLLFFTTTKLLAFAFCSSAAKRRDFDLLSQHRQVLCENFFSELFSTQRTPPARPRPFSPAPPTPQHTAPSCVALRFVISEAHDCSTGFSVSGSPAPFLSLECTGA